MLEIKELECQAGRTQILMGISGKIPAGEVCCIMGTNGSGKSTLLNTLMGHPAYKITGGELLYNEKDFTRLSTADKAQAGFFQSFQSPPEFPEASGWDVLAMLVDCRQETKVTFPQLQALTRLYGQADLGISDAMLARPFNEGFSGGERKRMEILQMLICQPKVLLLDEIDTGLHYTVMEDMWRLVHGTAKRLNIQIFATTHSSDCWKALAAICREPSISADATIQHVEKGVKNSKSFTGKEIVIAAERGFEVR